VSEPAAGWRDALGSLSRDWKRSLGIAAIAALIGASAVALAQGAGRSAADPDQARIEKVVREYVLAHPEIIPEAMSRLREREVAQAVKTHRSDLETPFGSAWAGARDGDVVLVEFFDYACSYCRASNPDVKRLLNEDKKLKVVFRELPVLGQDSVAAAHVSLAAARQGRFRPFYERMFAAGRPTPREVAAVRTALAIAPGDASDFDREIEKNYALARAINATGTPTFVVGDQVFQGAVGYDVLKQAIAEARRGT
jgi:protein-disulfide isomerase